MATSEFESSPPTITPVVDMSNVYRSASQIGNILSPSKVFTSGVSYDQAASIASTTSVTSDIPTEPAPVTTKEVTFVQNNYSPEALSTADIYRQSRNQIDLAKKELAVV
jgi:hypothetical protein